MDKLISTTEVARLFGVTVGRVRTLSLRRGITPAATACPCCGARGNHWTPEQVEKLRPGRVGRRPKPKGQP